VVGRTRYLRRVVRTWVRQALGAAGVAILVPAAVAVALALSAAGGGSGLGSLGQVLKGPAAPPAEAAQAPARQIHHAAGRGGGARAVAVGAVGSTPRAARPVRHRVTTVRPPARRPALGRPPVARPPAQKPPDAAPPSASAPPASAPAPAPRPVHDVGAQVADTVRPLPVAGPVAADAVQAVVDLVDPPA
jgi:hypothetical protein